MTVPDMTLSERPGAVVGRTGLWRLGRQLGIPVRVEDVRGIEGRNPEYLITPIDGVGSTWTSAADVVLDDD